MGETHILREVSPFLFNSFHILRLQKQSFFRIFERYATLPRVIFRAWATCGVDLPAGRFSLAFPPKPWKSAMGTRLHPGKGLS